MQIESDAIADFQQARAAGATNSEAGADSAAADPAAAAPAAAAPLAAAPTAVHPAAAAINTERPWRPGMAPPPFTAEELASHLAAARAKNKLSVIPDALLPLIIREAASLSEREALANYKMDMKGKLNFVSMLPPSHYGTPASVARKNQLPVFTPPAPNPDPLAGLRAFQQGVGSADDVLPREAEYMLGAGCEGDEPGFKVLILDPNLVGLNWATCISCSSHDTEIVRDEYGRIEYAPFAASSKQLGIIKVVDHERMAVFGPMLKCNEQGCRRKFHVCHVECLRRMPTNFVQQCTPFELSGVPEGSRERDLATRRFVGLVKRLARSSSESTETYVAGCADVEGVRFEERCKMYNKALGLVKLELAKTEVPAVNLMQLGYEKLVRSPPLVAELQTLRAKAALLKVLPSTKLYMAVHYGTAIPSASSLLKRYHRILIDEAPEKRRELQAVKVGSHLCLDDCPAIAKSFSLPKGHFGKVTLCAGMTANSHELAFAVLLPDDKQARDAQGNPLGGIRGKTPALQALAARSDFNALILTTDNQPTNRSEFYSLMPSLIGQARDSKHMMGDVNEQLNKYSPFYPVFMGRLKWAFFYEHEPTINVLIQKLTTPGGFPKGAQITVSLEPKVIELPDGTTKEEVVTEVRTWKSDYCISTEMAHRMRKDGTLRKTFNSTIPRLRRPRGLTRADEDREGREDPSSPAMPTVKQQLISLLADLKGDGPEGLDWGIDRANGKKPEYLWVDGREKCIEKLQRILDNLDVFVLPDVISASVSRYTIEPAYESMTQMMFATDAEMLGMLGRLLAGERLGERRDGRDLPLLRSLEQSTGIESKFSQLELALSHRYAAEKAEAIFLDKATTDNTVARREHMGEPKLPHTCLSAARRHDELCAKLGLEGPHRKWLQPLAEDTGELFLYQYYSNNFMASAERAEAAAELVVEVGEEEAELGADDEEAEGVAARGRGDTGARDEGDDAAGKADDGMEVMLSTRGRLAGEVDLELVPFYYNKPDKLSIGEKLVRTKAVNASSLQAGLLMPLQRLRELFREAGCDFDCCDENKKKRLLAWHPHLRSIPVSFRPDDGRSDYCIYDGTCYQLYPNLSMNSNGRKRQPRAHERGVCERYIGERIYEARFGAKKGRKRARDGG